MKRFKPTLILAFSLAALTLGLALTAYLLGVMPDEARAELDSRAKVAESIAVQLAGAASRDDSVTLRETLAAVVERNRDVLSAALRGKDGALAIQSGDHAAHWVAPGNGRSTPTHVTVPLVGADGPQGAIEIAFTASSAGGMVLGIPVAIWTFLGFMAVGGFCGYFLILRRTLRELDPSLAVPERVQRAFDTLTEGVVILDERERVMLVNDVFTRICGGPDAVPEKGARMNSLGWRMVDGRAQAGGYPWHQAIRGEGKARQELLSLRVADGTIHNFNVNANVINGDNGKTMGAIVTLRDVSAVNASREALALATERLAMNEADVTRKTKELEYLTTHDALSGCLNRRTFLQRLDVMVHDAQRDGTDLQLALIRIDGFRRIEEGHGPAVADRVLQTVAAVLPNKLPEGGIMGRHGSGSFLTATTGITDAEASEVGREFLRILAVDEGFVLPDGSRVRVSIASGYRMDETSTADAMLAGTEAIMRTTRGADTNAFPTREPARAVPSAAGTTGTARSHREAPHAAFIAHIDRSIGRADQSALRQGVVHLTIVAFDYLTEALGEAIAETLLIAAQRRIEGALRENDNVCRDITPGHFLVDLGELEPGDDLSWIVERVLKALKAPIDIDGRPHFLDTKAGTAVAPADGHDATTLLRHAAIAARRALELNDLTGTCGYDPAMTQASLERLDIETGIRAALADGSFEMFFQPIVDAKTGELAAAEALLRCNHPKLKGVYMDRLIATAEKSTLIAEIDMWVLRRSLQHMEAWCDAGLTLPKVSINLSARQLTNCDFMDDVFDTLNALRFDASRVQIEVTETARMADVETAAPELKRLQQLGCHIALDDFGTGQASLTYLQRLHPDVIKIDRSFITGVNANHANATLVSAMTVMAHCLGLTVVVEGVEEPEELAFLRDTHCDLIQGYFIARPMAASDFADWMEDYVGRNGAKVHASALAPPEVSTAQLADALRDAAVGMARSEPSKAAVA